MADEGPRSSGKRTERLQILLDEDELELLDEWRYRNHMPSRAAAIRDLLRRGLSVVGEERRQRRKSTDYRVGRDDKG